MPTSKRRYVLREVSGGIAAPCGFEAAGVECGLKDQGPDLALIYSVTPGESAGVFTRNVFQAAPVLVTKDRVGRDRFRALVVNSGNANACTGALGHRNALRMAEVAAEVLRVPPRSVLVASTGIIGAQLPMRKVVSGIRRAAATLGSEGAAEAERAILTTDTRPKSTAVEFGLDGRPVRVGGMAKGSGMIGPSMATMLAFLTTDAGLAPGLLQSCLVKAVENSFHRITVDGDTSTNDMVLLLANGQAEAGRVTTRHGLARFQAALNRVCSHLAREVVRDGEGASRLIEIRVRGADSTGNARRIAQTIATSPLVKTAIAGGDPNWGRVLAAAGRSGVDFRPELVELQLGRVQVVRDGVVCRYNRGAARKAVSGSEVVITLDLNAGEREATVWTCDLTAEYVRINAEYHT